MKKLTIFLAVLFTAAPVFAQTPTVPLLNKVVWVWLENTAYQDMIVQKYVKNLWFKVGAARFSNFKTLNPITQSNAVAMISGTDLGIQDNDLTKLFSPSLIDLLENKKIPWKVYAEDYPGACYLSPGIGDYRRYRVPFLSYSKIQSDRYLCAKIVNFATLESDRITGDMAQFSVIIPNIPHSGATTDAATADNALQSILNSIVSNSDELSRTTIIISTMSMKDPLKNAFAMILGNFVNTNGTTSTAELNHYSILRTIEEGLALDSLHQNDISASPITDIWKL